MISKLPDLSEKFDISYVSFIFLLLLVFVWIPFTIFMDLLNDFSKEIREFIDNRRDEKANEILADLERKLDVDFLVDRGLSKVTKRWNDRLREVNKEFSIHDLEREFYAIFPNSSVLIWFTQKGEWLPSDPNQKLSEGKTVWERFFKAVSDTSNTTDHQVAIMFIKTIMGELITLDFLRKSTTETLKIFFKGERFYFRTFLFDIATNKRPRQTNIQKSNCLQSTRMPGGCLVFIPIDRAKKGWQFYSLIKKIEKNKKSELAVGGLWQASEKCVSTSNLNQNLLRGLHFESTNYSKFTQGEFLFRGKFWSRDPDLFLVVGIGNILATFEALIFILSFFKHLSKWFIIIISFGTTLILIGKFSFSLSLKTRFKIVTFLLTIFPIGILFIIGCSHIIKTTRLNREKSSIELSKLIDRLELETAKFNNVVIQKLNNFLNDERLQSEQAKEILDNIFNRKEQFFGLNRILFIYQDHQPLIWNVHNSDIVFKHFLPYIRLHKRKPKRATELKTLLRTDMLQGILNFMSSTGKIQIVQLAETYHYLFHTFLYDHLGRRTVYISCSFDPQKFQEHQIKFGIRKLLKAIKNKSIYVHAKLLEGINTLPDRESISRKFKKILESVEFTGEALKTHINIHNQEYIVLARPLKGIKAIGLAAVPVSTKTDFMATTLFFLIMTVIVACLFSVFSYKLLTCFLLEPVSELTEAVSCLDSGNYSIEVPVTATDELGNLTNNFNAFVKGLQEKEKMSQFIRKDVILESLKEVGTMKRCNAAIVFVGIREFSKLESRLSPRAAMAIISHFLGLCEEITQKFDGEIDKFIGDTAMAIFLERSNQDGPAIRAVRYAIELEKQLMSWNNERKRLELPALEFGIGMTEGSVLAGKIGSLKKRLDFTVIGDTVNLAARLEKLASRKGMPRILITGQIARQIEKTFKINKIEVSEIRGKRESVEIFGISNDN